MPRPRQNAPADSFTSTELALGAGLDTRSFKTIMVSGLAPAPLNKASGREAFIWDTFGLYQAAMAGALHGAGVPLLLAAGITRRFSEEMMEWHGRFPAGFDMIRESAGAPRAGDAWLHRHLRIQRFGGHLLASDNDIFIEIVDRRYIFLGSRKYHFNWFDVGTNKYPAYVSPSARIYGWERKSDFKIERIVGAFDNLEDEFKRNKIKSIEDEFLHEWHNAIGVVKINASLAARMSLERVYNYRISHRSIVDWETSIDDPPEGGPNA